MKLLLLEYVVAPYKSDYAKRQASTNIFEALIAIFDPIGSRERL